MGILYVVSTPIGNLEDITIRAIKTLFTVDYKACEDTRITGQLLKFLKDKYSTIIRIIELNNPKLISYYDEIEFKRVPEIINLLTEGNNVALVSDNGTPLISDPGFKLVRECIKQDIKVISVPGPSSVITALTVSGLPTDKFLFLGFLPAKKQKRLNIFKSIYFDMRPHGFKYTIILFEASNRLKKTLSDIKEIFGDIEIVITRELTKIHEEVLREKISELLLSVEKFKGELVIVLPAIIA